MFYLSQLYRNNANKTPRLWARTINSRKLNVADSTFLHNSTHWIQRPRLILEKSEQQKNWQEKNSLYWASIGHVNLEPQQIAMSIYAPGPQWTPCTSHNSKSTRYGPKEQRLISDTVRTSGHSAFPVPQTFPRGHVQVTSKFWTIFVF